MGKTKEKKPIFNKLAPKVEGAMNSKVGQGVQKGLGIAGTILTIATGVMTVGSAIVGINHYSQEKINQQKELEMKIPE